LNTNLILADYQLVQRGALAIANRKVTYPSP